MLCMAWPFVWAGENYSGVGLLDGARTQASLIVQLYYSNQLNP